MVNPANSFGFMDGGLDLTDGFETGEIPTVWGTNTYSDRTVKQKLVVGAMRIADIKTQEANAKEKRTRGYDLKGFFFNFGYFLLMDDDWHARRLMIDFDIIPSNER